MTMKACILQKAGHLEVQEIELPKPQDNEILIRVAYAGICGSDLPRSMNENGARMYPLVLGHEFSGVVEELGSSVTSFQKGDRVAVAPLIPDPDNIYTKSALYGLSDNYEIIGTGRNGAFAEYISVPKEHVVRVPDTLSLKEAAGIEPTTISMHALYKSGLKAGEKVVVLGCGPIGQLAIQAAVNFGASEVIAVDIDDSKLELAKELGASHVINSMQQDLIDTVFERFEYGVDVVIETAGTAITQKQSLQISRKQGRIVWVGISKQSLELDAETVENILRKELVLMGSWNSYTAPYPGISWDTSLDLMGKGKIVFDPLISHIIQLEELNEYLNEMFYGNLKYNKVMVEVWKGE